MKIAELTNCPPLGQKQLRQKWFNHAKPIWKREFLNGGDPMLIVEKGVSRHTVDEWCRKYAMSMIATSKPVPGPSRESLMNAYFANPDSDDGREALTRAVFAKPSFTDLVGGVVDCDEE